MTANSNSISVEQENVNASLIVGLRELADWLESRPDVPPFRAFVHASLYSKDARAVLEEFAAALGDRATENVSYGAVHVVGQFTGGVSLDLSTLVGNVGGEKVEKVEYEPIIRRRVIARGGVR